MIDLLIKIFIFAFFINLLYELCHSVLYKTCLKASLPKYVYLILKAAIFDGFSITIIYFATYLIFKNENPFYNYSQLISFLLISLLFAFLYEKVSLAKNRWEYSDKMLLIFGVGLTPLLQLALTGFLVLHFTLNLY